MVKKVVTVVLSLNMSFVITNSQLASLETTLAVKVLHTLVEDTGDGNLVLAWVLVLQLVAVQLFDWQRCNEQLALHFFPCHITFSYNGCLISKSCLEHPIILDQTHFQVLLAIFEPPLENSNSTTTQLNLTQQKLGLHGNDSAHPPPPLHHYHYPSTTHTNSMSAISELLQPWYPPNFKGRFLE